MSHEDLESKQKLVLRSCGVQHIYLHLPLAAFEDAGCFCVLYPVMDQGNLQTQIADEGGKLTERQAVQKLVQPCLTALADLHAKALAHGAILPQNILFTSQESTCKLAGLFLSSQVSGPEGTAAMQRNAAPEQDTSSLESAVQSATAASDIFMLGGVTYEALVGRPAFPAKSDALSRGGRWQDPDMPLWLSDHAQDFLSKTVARDPSRRNAAAQLLKHPWLKSLGFRPPVDQASSSVEVVEPVLPPRPAPPPQPEIETLVITEPAAAEQHIVEEETIKAEVPEAEAPSTGVEAEPSSPPALNRSGGKHSITKPAQTETGWDLFYKSGSGSSPKAKPKTKVVVPTVGKAAKGSRRNPATSIGNKDSSGTK
ncbi:hypothetical protein ABBQ32_011687 [Trebouxia sp. C0010 RCD-2024]